MCCGCQLSFLIPNMDFQNTILLSLHVYPSENTAKSSVVQNFEKHENQILTYISKKILKTVLFYAYTFLQKLFSPQDQHCLPGFQITLVNLVHSDEIVNSAHNPPQNTAQNYQRFCGFFLTIEQSFGFSHIISRAAPEKYH